MEKQNINILKDNKENNLIYNEIIIIKKYSNLNYYENNSYNSLYKQIENIIPFEWFINETENDQNNYNIFSSNILLNNITERAKRKIWADIPRTFHIFKNKSNYFNELLSEEIIAVILRTILCRVLCTSSILLGGWYCQGMAFLAGSCILYLRAEELKNHYQEIITMTSSSSLSTTTIIDIVKNQSVGISSGSIYHYCFLKENNFEALYCESFLLNVYLHEFSYQLAQNPLTSEIHQHLNTLNFTVHHFALEWFTACYILNVTHELSLIIHDILIYGQDEVKSDFLIKIGVSIIVVLSSRLISFTSFEEIHQEFKLLVADLTPEQIIPFALNYQMIKHDFKSSMKPEDSPINVLKYINNNIEYFREQDQISRKKFEDDELVEEVDHKKNSKCLIQ